MWIAKFHNPKHTGDTDRVKRLQEQTEIVMTLASSMKLNLKMGAKHECLRSQSVYQHLDMHFRELLGCWRELKASIKGITNAYDSDTSNSSTEGSGTDEEDMVDYKKMEYIIAKTFLKKRYLLNLIFFLLSNEKEIEKKHSKDLLRLQELALDETTEWMELLDYVQTMKNPYYLT
jgi:hypothetical protein